MALHGIARLSTAGGSGLRSGGGWNTTRRHPAAGLGGRRRKRPHSPGKVPATLRCAPPAPQAHRRAGGSGQAAGSGGGLGSSPPGTPPAPVWPHRRGRAQGAGAHPGLRASRGRPQQQHPSVGEGLSPCSPAGDRQRPGSSTGWPPAPVAAGSGTPSLSLEGPRGGKRNFPSAVLGGTFPSRKKNLLNFLSDGLQHELRTSSRASASLGARGLFRRARTPPHSDHHPGDRPTGSERAASLLAPTARSLPTREKPRRARDNEQAQQRPAGVTKRSWLNPAGAVPAAATEGERSRAPGAPSGRAGGPAAAPGAPLGAPRRQASLKSGSSHPSKAALRPHRAAGGLTCPPPPTGRTGSTTEAAPGDRGPQTGSPPRPVPPPRHVASRPGERRPPQSPPSGCEKAAGSAPLSAGEEQRSSGLH
nr:basic salivary proline-rich protein 2-like [Anser cygnoides]